MPLTNHSNRLHSAPAPQKCVTGGSIAEAGRQVGGDAPPRPRPFAKDAVGSLGGYSFWCGSICGACRACSRVTHHVTTGINQPRIALHYQRGYLQGSVTSRLSIYKRDGSASLRPTGIRPMFQPTKCKDNYTKSSSLNILSPRTEHARRISPFSLQVQKLPLPASDIYAKHSRLLLFCSVPFP